MPLIPKIITIIFIFVLLIVFLYLIKKFWSKARNAKHSQYWTMMLACPAVIFLIIGIYAFWW